MIDHHHATAIRAHDLGRGLTDLERIALGAALIQTVLHSGYHEPVRLASSRIAEHAQALRDAQISGFSNMSSGSPATEVTTHVQVPLDTPSLETAGDPTPCALSVSSRWRMVWGQICRFEARVSEGLVGDVIALACVLIFCTGLCVFLPVLYR